MNSHTLGFHPQTQNLERFCKVFYTVPQEMTAPTDSQCTLKPHQAT